LAGRTFGIDFGTTNSLVSYVEDDGAKIIDLTDLKSQRPHPSVVWYRGGEIVVGETARANLDSGAEAVSGDFVRSPKRLLAGDAPVYVAGREIDPTDTVSEVLTFLRNDASPATRGRGGVAVDRAVFTIPVELDGAGRRRLRRAARKSGLSVVQFVHEPLAALYGYLRTQPDYRTKLADREGQRMLVFDWGGGTLDLTVCTVDRGRLVQLASRGDNSVGGDFFDEALRNHIKNRHAQEHGLEDINSLEAEGAAVRLLGACERAKIQLSSAERAPILVPGYLRTAPGRNLALTLTRSELESVAEKLVLQGLSQIDGLLEEANLSPQDIGLCLPTGGMVNMPLVREGLLQRFPSRTSRLEAGDRIIAQGAAWIAHDGLQLTLAKSIELLQPDGDYTTVVEAGQHLPIEDKVITFHQSNYYCVDPRDGVAHFQFARPTLIGHGARRSQRRTYGTVSVNVDPNAKPFVERLEAEIRIDADYIVTMDVRSTGRRDHKSLEVHDLEFALALPTGKPAATDKPDKQPSSAKPSARKGGIRLRSNIAATADAWSAVPGDMLTRYRGASAFSSPDITDRQKEERYYYEPCATCRRLGFDCKWEGCDHPVCRAQGMISQAEAVRVNAQRPTV
jgi:molecular chaperone DnaK